MVPFVEVMERTNHSTTDTTMSSLTATPPTRPFVISRTYDAPRERVFKLWTDREHLLRWWGPKGVTVVSCRNDLRPDGIMHYCLRTSDGHTMWGKWVYREIESPSKLVFVNSFSDEHGSVTRHPLAPIWPREMLSTITFTEQSGRTTVTIEWVPINASASENETFETGRDSMQQGWTGTLDQLGEYLSHPEVTTDGRR